MRWATAVWLWVVWVLLWGTFTPLTVAGGALVAALVLWLFPVRALPRLPLRPGPLLGLVGFLALDLLRSSLEVTREVLRHGADSRGAILELPLASTDDRVVAVIAAAYTLTPGTIVVQIDNARSRWYIYVLGPRDAAGTEAARAHALDVQRRVVAAIGSGSGEVA